MPKTTIVHSSILQSIPLPLPSSADTTGISRLTLTSQRSGQESSRLNQSRHLAGGYHRKVRYLFKPSNFTMPGSHPPVVVFSTDQAKEAGGRKGGKAVIHLDSLPPVPYPPTNRSREYRKQKPTWRPGQKSSNFHHRDFPGTSYLMVHTTQQRAQ